MLATGVRGLGQQRLPLGEGVRVRLGPVGKDEGGSHRRLVALVEHKPVRSSGDALEALVLLVDAIVLHTTST